MKACRRGHQFDESLRRRCLECPRMAWKKWNAAHPGAARAQGKRSKDARRIEVRTAGREYMRRRYEADPEKARASTRRYRLNHPEKVRATYRRWLNANLESERARVRAYIAADRPRSRAATKRWRKENPEKVRAIKRVRRARKLAATTEPFTLAQWHGVVARYGGLCAYCQVRPWEHQDHVIPLSRGGSHAIGNVVPACAPCNHTKHARTWTPLEVGA